MQTHPSVQRSEGTALRNTHTHTQQKGHFSAPALPCGSLCTPHPPSSACCSGDKGGVCVCVCVRVSVCVTGFTVKPLSFSKQRGVREKSVSISIAFAERTMVKNAEEVKEN